LAAYSAIGNLSVVQNLPATEFGPRKLETSWFGSVGMEHGS
jgi:hypothetical protein